MVAGQGVRRTEGDRFSFKHVKFEVPRRIPSKIVQEQFELLISLDLNGKNRAEYLESEISVLEMVE